MSLKPYQRDGKWYARGRVDYNGRPITEYIRASTGASSEAGARDWIRATEELAIRRHFLGSEAVFTFEDAVMLYQGKPKEAAFLGPILKELGPKPVAEITGKALRNLGSKIYPLAASDTWWRQVVTPARAVINNAHDLGKCPPIRVKNYSEQERIDQDVKRGKMSRVERRPSDRQWIEAFCRHADPYNAAMLRFMVETGARISQAVALTPDDLDLMRRRVWLQPAKGHAAQWVDISQKMVVELANLPAKRPYDRKNNVNLDQRVFGYASRGGYRKRWKSICTAAGIEYLTAHPAGRHGFYTELRIRLGVDPVTAAKAGRWKNPSLPDRIYAHVEADMQEIREKFRADPVQTDTQKGPKKLINKGKLRHE